MLGRRCWPLLLLGCTVACGRSATVYTKHGREIRGRIEGNEHGTLKLVQKGEPVEVDTTEIAEIEHPGMTAMTLGVFLVLGGATMMAIDPPWKDPECNTDGVCTGGLLGGFGAVTTGTGVGLGGYGLLIHQLSVSAAEPSAPPARGVSLGLRWR